MTAAARQSVEVAYAPEGLGLVDAARYVGLGTTAFLEAVKLGEMPKARRFRHFRRVVWLKRELDRALEDLPVDGQRESDEYAGVKL